MNSLIARDVKLNVNRDIYGNFKFKFTIFKKNIPEQKVIRLY